MSISQKPLASLSNALAGIFKKETPSHSSRSALPGGEQAPPIQRGLPAGEQSTLSDHWLALQSAGFAASQVIEFLQPIADLEGISVSYVYLDDAGREQIYNHRSDDSTFHNPLSQAIKEKRLTKSAAMKFALNDEGRGWIESNFMELE